MPSSLWLVKRVRCWALRFLLRGVREVETRRRGRDGNDREAWQGRDVQNANFSQGVNMYTLSVTSKWYCFRCSHLRKPARVDILVWGFGTVRSYDSVLAKVSARIPLHVVNVRIQPPQLAPLRVFFAARADGEGIANGIARVGGCRDEVPGDCCPSGDKISHRPPREFLGRPRLTSPRGLPRCRQGTPTSERRVKSIATLTCAHRLHHHPVLRRCAVSSPASHAQTITASPPWLRRLVPSPQALPSQRAASRRGRSPRRTPTLRSRSSRAAAPAAKRLYVLLAVASAKGQC